jgi:broad specificity phosphatase PhoE
MSPINDIVQFYLSLIQSFLGFYWLILVSGLIILLYLSIHLRAKQFYFVRHGRTILNEAEVKQSDKGFLNEKGVAQANRTGAYLQQFEIEKIFASPYERTVQTAEIINQYLKTSIVYDKSLVERRNPSDVVGKSIHDIEVKKIMDLVDLSYHADDLRYSDEENFEDLKKRASEALRFLAKQPFHRMAVVTHGIFLKMLLSYMLHQEGLHNEAYVRLSFFNPADNGGITICEYTPWKRWFSETGGWKILTYNQNLTD